MLVDEIHFLIDAGKFDEAISQMSITGNGNNEIYYTLMKIEIKIKERDYLTAKSLLSSITGKNISDVENAYMVYCRCFLWNRTKPLTEYSDIIKILDKNLSFLEKSIPDQLDLISKHYSRISIMYLKMGLIKLSLDKIMIFAPSIKGINDGLRLEILMLESHLLRLQGEYKLSLATYIQCLEINKKIKNQTQEVTINANIGLIYLNKIQYDKAKSYLFKALTDFVTPLFKAEILINLFYINFKEGKIDYDSLAIIGELSQFNPKVEKIQLIYEYAQALIHYSKPRLSDKINALPIFEKLIHYDKDPEFQLINMKFYCELLLDEYIAYKDPNVRVELSELIDKIILTAQANNQFYSLVVGYLLKSKMNLIDFDLDNALLNLNKSTKIAKSKDFQVMLLEISNLTEEINDIVFSWQKLAEEGSHVIRESEEAMIMNYLEDIVKILKM